MIERWRSTSSGPSCWRSATRQQGRVHAADAIRWTAAAPSSRPAALRRRRARRRRHVIGQANNVFISPASAGCDPPESQQIDEGFPGRRAGVADCVTRSALGRARSSDVSELRAVSAAVAAAVVRYATERELGRHFADSEVERSVAAASWYPAYVPLVPAEFKVFTAIVRGLSFSALGIVADSMPSLNNASSLSASASEGSRHEPHHRRPRRRTDRRFRAASGGRSLLCGEQPRHPSERCGSLSHPPA